MTLAPQPEDSGAREEDTQQYYDPVAAATNAWGDDGSQPVRYDPIAAAAEGWGDDSSKPVRYDPVAEAQEGGGGDEIQQVHYDPMAEAQKGWGDDESQPVTEVPATEDETPAAEAPAEAAEGESTVAATALDNEEGQVTEERNLERCIWAKVTDALIFFLFGVGLGRLSMERKHMIKRYVVNGGWKDEENLDMQRFRMHLEQQQGCIDS